MKTYLLDTNICVFFLRKQYAISEKLKQAGLRNCYISEITVGELLYGAFCSQHKEKHIKQIDEFVGLFIVKPIYPVLSVFAEEKAKLRKQGLLIDDFDLLIGATALKYDMTLVTENIKHLSHINGLHLENWISR